MDFVAEAFLEKISSKLSALRRSGDKSEEEEQPSIYTRTTPAKKKGDAEGSSLYLVQLQNELKRFYSANPSMRLRACRELSHLCYYGGELVQNNLANESKPLDVLLSLVRNPLEGISMRLQAIQTVSVLCRGSKILVEALTSRGIVRILSDLLEDSNAEVRQWATHALLFLMIRTWEKQQDTLQNSQFQEALRRVAVDDWNSWAFNDAEELLKLCSVQPV